MKHMKKLISLLVTAAMLLSMVPAVLAAEKPVVDIGDATVDLKGTNSAQVAVTIQNNPGITSAEMQIEYDSDNLTLSKVAVDPNASEEATFVGKPPKIAWAFNGLDPETYEGINFTANGNLFLLTFTAKEGAVNGDYTISIGHTASSPDCIFGDLDSELPDSDFTFTTGTITVTGGVDATPVIKTQPENVEYTYGTTGHTLSVALDNDKFTTGTELKHQWYVVDGETEIPLGAPTDNYAQISVDGLPVGTYTYYCAVTNTYSGKEYTAKTNKVTVTVNPAVLTAENVTVTEPTYTGSELVPTVTVAIGGTQLAEVTDYTVTVTAKTEVNTSGKYTLTVEGKGNYAGKITADWNIKNAKITVTGEDHVNVYNNGKTYALPIEITTVYDQPYEIAFAAEDSTLVKFDKNTNTLKGLGKTGSTTATLTITASNHEAETYSFTVSVSNKANVDGKISFELAEAPTNVYTGTEYKLNQFVEAAQFTGTPSGTGKITYTVEYTDFYGETTTSEVSDLADCTVLDAGTYKVTANYEDEEQEGSKSVSFTIAKAVIVIGEETKWDYTGAFTYDGDFKAVALTGLNEKVEPSYSGTTFAKDAGSYTAGVVLLVGAGYSKNYEVQGSVADLVWTINPAKIDVSGVKFEQAEIPYDGNPHTVAVSNLPANVTVTYGGDAATQTNAKTYKTTATLAPAKNYVLTGLDNLTLTLNWTIAPAKVTVPTVADQTFDNTDKTGVSAGELYTVKGVNTAKNAGDYEAIVSLTDKNNYQWDVEPATSEDQIVVWKIKPASVNTTDNPYKVAPRYNATEVVIALDSLLENAQITSIGTPTVHGDNENIRDVEMVGTDVKITLASGEKDIGEKAVITIYASSKNYKPCILCIEVTISDKVQVNENITFADPDDTTYTGLDQLESFKTAAIDGITAGANPTWTYKVNGVVNGAMKDAGTYTVVAIYEDADNYGESAPVEIVIEKAELTVTGAAVADKNYNGKTDDAAVSNVTFAGLVAEEKLEAADYTVSNAVYGAANAGTQTVTFTVALNDTEKANNYTLKVADGTASGKINPAAVTVDIDPIASVTYTGSAIEPAVTVKAEGTVDGYKLVEGTDYTVGYAANTNAGTATVTVTAVKGSNYTFTAATENFTIGQAELTVSAEVLTVDYTGKELTDSAIKGTAQFNGKDVAGTWTWVTKPSSVNASATPYSAVVKFTPNATDAPNFVQPADLAITVTINKAKPAGAPVITGVEDEGKTLADVKLELGTLPAGGTLIWVDENGNELPLTTEIELEKEYTWKYIPSAENAGNYTELTGTVVLCANKPFIPTGNVITKPVVENGTVTLNTYYALKGTTIFVTVAPNAGYKLGTLMVTDAYGKMIPVTDLGGGKFAFVMPNVDVAVNATFVKNVKISFIDVPAYEWYFDAVGYVSANGLMNGVGDGTKFDPTAKLTRAMLMTILARLDGVDTNGGATWYTKGMEWAKANGISDGTNPNGNITREQTVTMLWRFANSPVVTGDRLVGYADVANVSSWAKDAMNWAVSVGLIQGNGGKLNPAGNASRAEIATMLMRFIENVIK